jgi:hypothetical protein
MTSPSRRWGPVGQHHGVHVAGLERLRQWRKRTGLDDRRDNLGAKRMPANPIAAPMAPSRLGLPRLSETIIATRYDKRAGNYRPAVVLVGSLTEPAPGRPGRLDRPDRGHAAHLAVHGPNHLSHVFDEVGVRDRRSLVRRLFLDVFYPSLFG